MVCLLATAMCLLPGCAKGVIEQSEGPFSIAASEGNRESGSMGRYLEHEVTLPEAMFRSEYRQRHYVQTLDSGELALMDMASGMYLSKDQGKTWEEKEMPWLDTYCENAYISMIALSPDGGAAVIYDLYEEETESGSDAYMPQYCYADADGNVKEFTWQSEDNYIHQFWFGKDSRLYAYTIQGEVYEMDLEKDAHKELFQMEGLSEYVCFTKQYMVIFGTRDVVLYDTKSGMLAKEDKVLRDFVRDNVGNSIGANADSYQVVAAEGEQEDVIYVAYSAGVYRHVIGGTAMEQVMDGAMNSLGNPMMLLEGFLVLPDNEFVILYQEPKLCHYIFDPDMPSVPEEEFSIYSLKDDYAIRQAVSLFQKEHPEVYIRYEIGLLGDSSLTTEDALKNLNTRMMAGSGPSLLVLDGLPATSYQEKGVLADISGIVYDMSKENKLFTNLLDACRDEGKLFYVPIRFRLPLLIGNKEDIANIRDLSSLADAVEKLRKEHEKGGILGLLTEDEVLRTLLMTSSGALTDKKNKILDEEKLTDFLVQARRIYQAEIAGYDREELADYQENYQEQWNTGPASEGMYYAVASANAVDIAREAQKMGVGLTYGMDCEFNIISTLASQKADFDYQLWQGQVEKGFIPAGMVGICSGAQENPRVLEFFRFLYSEKVQDLDMPTGFPVNEISFGRLKENPKPEGAVGGIVISGEDMDDIFSLEVQWSSKEDFAKLQGYVKEIANVCQQDTRIEELICEVGAKVLHGSEEPEEAVTEIVKKASIYLAE